MVTPQYFSTILQILLLVNLAKSERIPCLTDMDCKVTSDDPLIEIIYKCKEDFCSYNSNVTIGTAIAFGDRCSFHEECNMRDSHCKNNKCTCKEGLVLSEIFTNTCIPVAQKLGSICVQNTQCPFENSTCSEQRCQCVKGYRASNTESKNECFKTRPLGSPCKDNDECTLEFSKCSPNGECVCNERFVQHEESCLMISRTILSPCKIDLQCQIVLSNLSFCSQGQCQCRKGYEYDLVLKKCIEIRVLDIKEEVEASGAARALHSCLVVVITAIVHHLLHHAY